MNVDALTPFFRICNSTHRRTKTLASNRDLPIALKLIELGIIEYVRTLRDRGEFWLFSEFNSTNVPARKRFLKMFFVPMLAYHFLNRVNNAFHDKDINTQSLREFAASYLAWS